MVCIQSAISSDFFELVLPCLRSMPAEKKCGARQRLGADSRPSLYGEHKGGVQKGVPITSIVSIRYMLSLGSRCGVHRLLLLDVRFGVWGSWLKALMEEVFRELGSSQGLNSCGTMNFAAKIPCGIHLAFCLQ